MHCITELFTICLLFLPAIFLVICKPLFYVFIFIVAKLKVAGCLASADLSLVLETSGLSVIQVY